MKKNVEGSHNMDHINTAEAALRVQAAENNHSKMGGNTDIDRTLATIKTYSIQDGTHFRAVPWHVAGQLHKTRANMGKAEARVEEFVEEEEIATIKTYSRQDGTHFRAVLLHVAGKLHKTRANMGQAEARDEEFVEEEITEKTKPQTSATAKEEVASRHHPF
jgi:hypothetical protein